MSVGVDVCCWAVVVLYVLRVAFRPRVPHSGECAHCDVQGKIVTVFKHNNHTEFSKIVLKKCKPQTLEQVRWLTPLSLLRVAREWGVQLRGVRHRAAHKQSSCAVLAVQCCGNGRTRYNYYDRLKVCLPRRLSHVLNINPQVL